MLNPAIQDILTGFESVTLSEMDRVKLMNRVDTKFAFSLQSFIKFLPELSQAYKILEIEGTRTPFYESLYFDDERFSFFQDHHNGRTNRFKVRFRKYVESNL
ncbi:MAG: VTC domain-containing protein, partial [Flavobacteriia bacterium]